MVFLDLKRFNRFEYDNKVWELEQMSGIDSLNV